MQTRYDELAERQAELVAELQPIEREMFELHAGLKAMGAVVADPPHQAAPLLSIVRDVTLGEQLAAIVSAPPPRVRHPDLQAAIDAQSPSVAIPPGSHVECMDCAGSAAHHRFPDLMALRSHVKRRHDREPTEAEQQPRAGKA